MLEKDEEEGGREEARWANQATKQAASQPGKEEETSRVSGGASRSGLRGNFIFIISLPFLMLTCESATIGCGFLFSSSVVPFPPILPPNPSYSCNRASGAAVPTAPPSHSCRPPQENCLSCAGDVSVETRKGENGASELATGSV